MLRTTGGSKRKNRSTVLEHTAATAPLSDSEKTEEEDSPVDNVEAPPKISRLTRLKEKTHKLRKKSETSKKSGGKKSGVDNSNVNNNNTGTKTNNTEETNPSNEAPLPPEANQMEKTKGDSTDASVLPYCSLLNNGSQGQIQLLLKEKVFSPNNNNNIANPPKTIDENLPSDNSILADAAEKTCSTPNKNNNNKAAVMSPARSTMSSRSESYLQDLRKGLSPTANAILEDLSAGIAPYTDAVVGKPIDSDSACHLKGGSNSKPQQGSPIPFDGHKKEMIRINRKVFEKLHQKVEGLKKSNLQLNNELVSIKRKRNDSVQKLAETKKQLEHVEAKEQVYVSQLDLVKSRLEIANIQADKRQRELRVSKEKSIAENDKVIAVLTKRIEGLEKTNQRLVEQLKRHEVKRQEKTSTLQAQYDRLKMKFSAQSTLLDNVMTANEELTSQNEAMETELMNYGGNVVVSGSKPPLHNSVSSTGMFFAEGSENEMEHIKRDPILLAQAKDLSFYRERTTELEEQVERLSDKLQALKELQAKAEADKPIEASESFSEGNDDDDENAAIETAPSLFDVLTSSGEDDPKSSHSRRSLSQETKMAQDPNTSLENPSDAGTTFKLKYQHHYETNGASSDADDETVSTKSHRLDQRSNNNNNVSLVESASSLVLMKRILELETTLRDVDLDPEESDQFVKALRSRISHLTEKGHSKVGSVEAMTDVSEEQHR